MQLNLLPGHSKSIDGRKSRFATLAVIVAFLAAGLTGPAAFAAHPLADAVSVAAAAPLARGVAGDGGQRPPLGRRVAAQPDDGALTTSSAPAPPAGRLQTASTV